MLNLGLQTDPQDLGSVALGITGASVGQYAKVKTVDGSGKPLAWEASTPSGGGLTQDVAALLMSILNAGTYSPSQASNLAELAALIINITWSQSGTTLVGSGAPDVTSITQSGTTLALA